MKNKTPKNVLYNTMRGARFRTICSQWLKEHRPDVVDAIWVEVDKQFPLKKRRPKGIALPPALEKLK